MKRKMSRTKFLSRYDGEKNEVHSREVNECMFWENKRGNRAVFFAVDNLRQDQAVGMRWWSWWCWELWSRYGRQRGRCQTAFPSLSWAFRPTRNILVASISVSFRRSLSLCSLAVMRRRRRPLSGCTTPHLPSSEPRQAFCGTVWLWLHNTRKSCS